MNIKSIVDRFVSSDYFANWQAENIESGGYMRSGSDGRDRYERCHDAAEDGAEGSTHRECIDDMRQAFEDWLRDRHRGRPSEYPYRVQDAAAKHWNALEQWHQNNGSLDQQIG